jgi:hypothetical protein
MLPAPLLTTTAASRVEAIFARPICDELGDDLGLLTCAAPLRRGQTETGVPFLIVADPGAGLDDAWPIITRGEHGWQMHRGEEGPLYQFATAREVAEFFL